MRNYGKRLMDKLCKTFPELRVIIYNNQKSKDWVFFKEDQLLFEIRTYRCYFIFAQFLPYRTKQFKYSKWYLACQLIYELLNKH